MLISCVIVAVGIGENLANPTLYFAFKIFFTEWASRSSVNFFCLKARFIFLTAFLRSLGIKRMSFPAKKAATSMLLILDTSEAAPIFKASVIINPL